MLNLIFDLDATLINSLRVGDDMNQVVGMNTNDWDIIRPKKTKAYLLLKRKGLELFLQFCFENFNVGFWTNGMHAYGNAILDKILTTEQKTQTICFVGRVSEDQNFTKYKKSVWKKGRGKTLKISSTHFKAPTTNHKQGKNLCDIYNKEITKNNTLLIDDAGYNKAQNAQNAILIPEFEEDTQDDNTLFLLIDILSRIQGLRTIKTVDTHSIQLKLFRNIKPKKPRKIIRKNYVVGSEIKVVYPNGNTLNAFITKVFKKQYEIMHTEKGKFRRYRIAKSRVKWEWLYSV